MRSQFSTVFFVVVVAFFGVVRASHAGTVGHSLEEVKALHRRYRGTQQIFVVNELVHNLKIHGVYGLHVGMDPRGNPLVLLNQGTFYIKAHGHKIYTAPNNVYLLELYVIGNNSMRAKLAPGVFILSTIDTRHIARGRLRIAVSAELDIRGVRGRFKLAESDVHVMPGLRSVPRPVPPPPGTTPVPRSAEHRIWLENHNDFPLYYALNGQQFNLPRGERWHSVRGAPIFNVEFDGSFLPGYQRRAYQLAPGSRNVFRVIGQDVDLLKR